MAAFAIVVAAAVEAAAVAAVAAAAAIAVAIAVAAVISKSCRLVSVNIVRVPAYLVLPLSLLWNRGKGVH